MRRGWRGCEVGVSALGGRRGRGTRSRAAPTPAQVGAAAAEGVGRRTGLAALAVGPLHDPRAHLAPRPRLAPRGLLECVPEVRGAEVRILEVGHADGLPCRHHAPKTWRRGRGRAAVSRVRRARRLGREPGMLLCEAETGSAPAATVWQGRAGRAQKGRTAGGGDGAAARGSGQRLRGGGGSSTGGAEAAAAHTKAGRRSSAAPFTFLLARSAHGQGAPNPLPRHTYAGYLAGWPRARPATRSVQILLLIGNRGTAVGNEPPPTIDTYQIVR